MNAEPRIEPVKTPSSEEVAKLYRDHGGRYMNGLKDALHLCPGELTRLKLERWIKAPTDDPLTPEQVEFLHQWTRGYFAISNATGEYIRVRKEPGVSMILGVRGDINDPKHAKLREHMQRSEKLGEGWETGNAITRGPDMAAPNKGGELPEGDARKVAAAKRRDREAEEQRIKSKRERGGVVQSLMTFGKGKG